MAYLTNTTIDIIEPLKWRPVDVKPSIFIDFDKENNKESPKFKVGDIVRISKYKNSFAMFQLV